MANDFNNMFSGIIYNEDIRGHFNGFMKEYGGKSEKEIYREIQRVQGQVSNDIKKRHIKNLESLAQIEGFVPERTKYEIERVKRLIKIDETSSKSTEKVETLYTSPTSLLLWFLLLTALWKGRYRRRRFY